MIGIVSIFLILFGFYSLLIWTWQGEFIKYDDGVTIEIKNSSKQVIIDLNFFFAFENAHVYQDLGNINKIEPGETTSLYSPIINGVGNDRSLYLQYPVNITEKAVESLAYVASYKPSKVIVIIEIFGFDNKGKLLFSVKGFDDISQYEFDLTSVRE